MRIRSQMRAGQRWRCTSSEVESKPETIRIERLYPESSAFN